MSRKWIALAALTVLALTALVPSVRAADLWDNFQTDIRLVSNQYPGIPSNWFSPGDPIAMELTNTVAGTDASGTDDHDVVLHTHCFRFALPTCDWTQRISSFDLDNVALDTAGRYSNTYSGLYTTPLADGEYTIWVGWDDYHTTQNNNRLLPPGNRAGNGGAFDFEVHLYTIDASFDRAAYLPGDIVTVFYTVTYVSDGSLVDSTDFQGRWEAWDPTGATLTGNTVPGTQPQGSFTFLIPGNAPVGDWYTANIWWNDTLTNGQTRHATWTDSVWVDALDADVTLRSPGGPASSSFELDTTIQADVDVWVENTGVPVEKANVAIEVFEGVGSTKTPFSPRINGTFQTTKDGRVQYLFRADGRFTVGEQYTVEADSFKNTQKKTPIPSQIFSIVQIRNTISVGLTFNKETYLSDDSMTIRVNTAPPAGRPDATTFALRISSGGGRTFLNTVQTSRDFTWRVPRDFAGTVVVRADVYNALGDYGFLTETREVAFGLVVVNSDPSPYDAGDTIRTTYEFISEVIDNPIFYYEVRDAGGSLVAEGTPTAATNRTGSFTFIVPAVPADRYTFSVFASGSGLLVSGWDLAEVEPPYLLTITFDTQYYTAGSTVTATYTIEATGDDKLPTTLVFVYSIKDGPASTLQVSRGTSDTEFSGTLTYVVPADTNEGRVEFNVLEIRSGARADEVLNVMPAPAPPPAITAIELVLLLLIVVLFVLVLLAMRRPRGTAAPPAGPAPGYGTAPPAGPQDTMVAGGLGMSVNCRACGKPIEITTSKRPIEVMCPACGNTEVVK